MKMSELSTTTGVPVPTIKFYLREGLLAEGRRTSATQAQYDDAHVARLRLIRALIGTAGLSVATARRVLDEVDDPPEAFHDLLGAAQATVVPTAAPDADISEVLDMLAELGWQNQGDTGRDVYANLAHTMQALHDAGIDMPDGMVDVYGNAMLSIAQGEIASTPRESLDEIVRYVILGTVLVDPFLSALRRVAQQEASFRIFGSMLGGSETSTKTEDISKG